MKKLTMILLVCIITVGYSVSAYAADWQWITSTDTNTFSFDKESIRKTTTGKYTVWTKNEYTEAESRRMSDEFMFDKPLAYVLSRIEFDYKNENMGFQAEAYYAKDGSVLYNYTNKYYDLTPIIPDISYSCRRKITSIFLALVLAAMYTRALIDNFCRWCYTLK